MCTEAISNGSCYLIHTVGKGITKLCWEHRNPCCCVNISKRDPQIFSRGVLKLLHKQAKIFGLQSRSERNQALISLCLPFVSWLRETFCIFLSYSEALFHSTLLYSLAYYVYTLLCNSLLSHNAIHFCLIYSKFPFSDSMRKVKGNKTSAVLKNKLTCR
jgi:hypothetical protein